MRLLGQMRSLLRHTSLSSSSIDRNLVMCIRDFLISFVLNFELISSLILIMNE